MLYFLHIPRTAGRTFYSCLLRIGTPGRRRCPKAYDHLRINTELPNCSLLSSHDDFSVVEALPANTTVVSQVRDPVQRILSAYEFAIEVAARQLRRSRGYTKPKGKIVTDDVWPWSYLIPFFVADIKPKVGDGGSGLTRVRGSSSTEAPARPGRSLTHPLAAVRPWLLCGPACCRWLLPSWRPSRPRVGCRREHEAFAVHVPLTGAGPDTA